MEEIMNSIVSQEDLNKFEDKYKQELENKNVTTKTQFEYAWHLVRSPFTPDIQKGILLLEDLSTRHSEGNRDYIYYLAIGNARLKQYSTALRFCKEFLKLEPNNQQVLNIEEYVKSKMEKEVIRGAAVAGGAVLAIGGILALGISLLKNRKPKRNQ